MMSPTMSDPGANDGHGGDDASGEVLRNLPRTRPQRPSARRVHRGTEPPPGGPPSDAAGSPAPAPAPPKPASPRKRTATAKAGATAEPSATAKGGAAAKPSATTKAGAAANAPATPKPAARQTRAARKPSAAPKATGGAAPRKAGASAGRATAGAKRTRATANGRGAPPAPQGFEPEATVGVDPPSVADVLDSALGTAADVAQAGFELGGRAVRGALSRLLGG